MISKYTGGFTVDHNIHVYLEIYKFMPIFFVNRKNWLKLIFKSSYPEINLHKDLPTQDSLLLNFCLHWH